jgi:hypothetical protein
VFAAAVADVGRCVKVETAVREGAGGDNAGGVAVGNVFAGDGALGDVGVVGVQGVGGVDNAVAVPAAVRVETLFQRDVSEFRSVGSRVVEGVGVQ